MVVNAKITLNPSQFKSLQQRIYSHAEKVVIPYYFQQLQQIMSIAADVGREYMNQPPNYTPTGEARKAKGGNGPGRVDTGEMQREFKWAGSKVSTTKGLFEVGWLDGAPSYAIFQEYGTKHILVGMNALNYTREFIRQELKLLEIGGVTYGVRKQGTYESE